ncbi:protein-L-isoaspartate(D-aspartate) O-methyltransferase [Natronospirillum operosum]|uniref:Protein-L-isoaspartate O-methyltransferase n=1 Tax=Natronospirillum operosum TaxID=2759953 RepID=A0A4Z0WBG9_9GAMM|nr:protein-L-isoaspartate(D-aspartate) O-methyltransferase [Natronospirillum operosum]TGG95144.1 protein-L-isoaspartate(D-aspartate) O-methyltransferase [Natronospirillum operosum]
MSAPETGPTLTPQGIGMTSERTRRRMVERLRERGIHDAAVLDVLFRVPRHWFVDEALAHRTYDDVSLPIGYGQTLSNSYTVARMTSLLREAVLDEAELERVRRPAKLGRVLEIGTGSGYQTSVLAHLTRELHTVERIQGLQQKARRRCREQSLYGIQFHLSDGHWGLAEHAPYQGILCTAAPATVPEALLEQLDPEGGVLILPVGPDGDQRLLRIIRQGSEWTREDVEAVCFVPLVNGTRRTDDIQVSDAGSRR